MSKTIPAGSRVSVAYEGTLHTDMNGNDVSAMIETDDGRLLYADPEAVTKIPQPLPTAVGSVIRIEWLYDVYHIVTRHNNGWFFAIDSFKQYSDQELLRRAHGDWELIHDNGGQPA